MIIKVTAHKSSSEVVVVHANAELAAFMGSFAPARWQPTGKVYWLETQHLDAFTRHADRAGHTVIDDRASGPATEKFTGPLPECGDCGQPASRRVALALTRCPACGAPWRPRIGASDGINALAPRSDCRACGASQRTGWGFCGRCGAPMPPPAALGTRPAPPPASRPTLAEPALFGDLVADVADALDPHRDDDGPDHMQRAAGDR